jgi:hypothetical protein
MVETGVARLHAFQLHVSLQNSYGIQRSCATIVWQWWKALWPSVYGSCPADTLQQRISGGTAVYNLPRQATLASSSRASIHNQCALCAVPYGPSTYPTTLHALLPLHPVCLQDRVTPSPTPNSWRLRDIFLVGIVYGLYLTLSTWVLYHVSGQG